MFSELVKKAGFKKFLVAAEFSIADIAVGSMLDSMDVIESAFGLVQRKERYPELVAYWQWMGERRSFQETKPFMFELTEKVA